MDEPLTLFLLASAAIGALGGGIVSGWAGALLGACAIVIFGVGSVALF